jgi:hypothetical protein
MKFLVGKTIIERSILKYVNVCNMQIVQPINFPHLPIYCTHTFHVRLWVFSCFLLFEMSVAALSMWSIVCIEAISVDTIRNAIGSFFFSHKKNG